MRIVIQRVSHASVTIDGVCKSAIEKGLMILVGIEEADNQEDADWLCKKVIGLKGNRPSYIRAARPETAIPLYEYFCNELSIALGREVGTGEFGADMKVELLNNGPVTICMDSKNKE